MSNDARVNHRLAFLQSRSRRWFVAVERPAPGLLAAAALRV